MVSPTVLPGLAFAQNARRSTLLFHYRAQDLSLKTVDGGVTGTFTRASLGGLVNGRGQITDAADTDVRLVGPHADNQPRFGVSSDGVPELLLEAARTNLCLRSSEFDNGSWAKTTTTIAANSVAAPDALGTADTLTASAGNGTVIQDLGAIGSAAHTFSPWLKRKTGTGNIQLTLDNGSAWTTKTLTDEWARYSITQTLANPDVGIRIVTNADAIYAWGAQAEAGSFLSSPIPTVGSTVTRALETFSIPFTAVPQEMTVLVTFVEGGGFANTLAYLMTISESTPRLWMRNDGTTVYELIHNNGATSVTTNVTPSTAPVAGDVVELLGQLSATGAVAISISINAGAEQTSGASAANTLSTSWTNQTLGINSRNGGASAGINGFVSLKIESGTKTLSQMREAF